MRVGARRTRARETRVGARRARPRANRLGAPRAGVALAAAAVAVTVAAAPASTAADEARPAAKTTGVKVRDDFYSKTSVKIRKGQKVKWRWGSVNFDPHDVTLKKGPKKVKKKQFRSLTASIDYSWAKKFKVKGTYKFFCTIHPITMQMDVKVRG